MDIATFKLNFFDAKSVTDPAERAKKRLLSRVGAFTRTKARQSLKYGTGVSPPGQPPVVHRSIGFTRKKKVKGTIVQQPASPLRELLFFAYDPSAESVVIGPAIGGSRTGAPEALEWGGSTKVVRNGHTTTILIGARPTVTPALETEAPKAIKTLKDSL